MFNVYLVEDEKNLNHLMSLYLQKEGWRVTSFLNVEEARKHINKKPHIWIMDDMLPNSDGYQLLSEIKERDVRLPVILTSDRNTNVDRVIGLELGCDDYLPKPFLPRELVIRTKNLIGRTYGTFESSRKIANYKINPYSVDEIKRIVLKNNEIIELSSKEFDLLLLFVKNPLRTFSRDQILNFVWGEDHFGSDRLVDDLVRRVRKKLHSLRIETIYGYGYRMLG